eukprot:gene2723-biopygen8059
MFRQQVGGSRGGLVIGRGTPCAASGSLRDRASDCPVPLWCELAQLSAVPCRRLHKTDVPQLHKKNMDSRPRQKHNAAKQPMQIPQIASLLGC